MTPQERRASHQAEDGSGETDRGPALDSTRAPADSGPYKLDPFDIAKHTLLHHRRLLVLSLVVLGGLEAILICGLSIPESRLATAAIYAATLGVAVALVLLLLLQQASSLTGSMEIHRIIERSRVDAFESIEIRKVPHVIQGQVDLLIQRSKSGALSEEESSQLEEVLDYLDDLTVHELERVSRSTRHAE